MCMTAQVTLDQVGNDRVPVRLSPRAGRQFVPPDRVLQRRPRPNSPSASRSTRAMSPRTAADCQLPHNRFRVSGRWLPRVDPIRTPKRQPQAVQDSSEGVRTTRKALRHSRHARHRPQCPHPGDVGSPWALDGGEFSLWPTPLAPVGLRTLSVVHAARGRSRLQGG